MIVKNREKSSYTAEILGLRKAALIDFWPRGVLKNINTSWQMHISPTRECYSIKGAAQGKNL